MLQNFEAGESVFQAAPQVFFQERFFELFFCQTSSFYLLHAYQEACLGVVATICCHYLSAANRKTHEESRPKPCTIIPRKLQNQRVEPGERGQHRVSSPAESAARYIGATTATARNDSQKRERVGGERERWWREGAFGELGAGAVTNEFVCKPQRQPMIWHKNKRNSNGNGSSTKKQKKREEYGEGSAQQQHYAKLVQTAKKTHLLVSFLFL